MFAIAFDLVVADALEHHPKGVRAAYDEVERSLLQFEFKRVQGSVFLSESEDLANLLLAMNALKALPVVPEGGSGHPGVPRRAMVGLHGVHEGVGMRLVVWRRVRPSNQTSARGIG